MLEIEALLSLDLATGFGATLFEFGLEPETDRFPEWALKLAL